MKTSALYLTHASPKRVNLSRKGSLPVLKERVAERNILLPTTYSKLDTGMKYFLVGYSIRNSEYASDRYYVDDSP